MASISMAGLQSAVKTGEALGLIGVGATAATAAVVSLTAAMVAGSYAAIEFSNRAATVADAMNNVEQTFGTSTDAVVRSVERQVSAFGRSRAEMLNYADTVGREL